MHAFELAVGLAAPGQYPRSQCLRSRHGSASIAKRDTFGGNAPVITLQEREAGSPASCSGASRFGSAHSGDLRRRDHPTNPTALGSHAVGVAQSRG